MNLKLVIVLNIAIACINLWLFFTYVDTGQIISAIISAFLFSINLFVVTWLWLAIREVYKRSRDGDG